MDSRQLTLKNIQTESQQLSNQSNQQLNQNSENSTILEQNVTIKQEELSMYKMLNALKEKKEDENEKPSIDEGK